MLGLFVCCSFTNHAAHPQLRERVKDVMRPPLHTDISLYKFLKARNFKIDVAEKLYRSTIAFRDADRVDYIFKEYERTEVCGRAFCLTRNLHYDLRMFVPESRVLTMCTPKSAMQSVFLDRSGLGATPVRIAFLPISLADPCF